MAAPIRREVPQGMFIVASLCSCTDVTIEHSHEQFLTAVRTTLNLNNPDAIVDPVFSLLGNAAAAQGLGNIAVRSTRLS